MLKTSRKAFVTALQKQKTFTHEKKNALKKSQKDGSKNGKPKLNRWFMERKGKDFSQNIQAKKDRWKIEKLIKSKESPRSPTSE